MNFDKESKSRKKKFFFGGGGEGGGLWTQKPWELLFLYGAHRQDLFVITVKNYDNIPKGIQVMEQTWNYIWNHQGEITQKVCKWELSFLYLTHHQDVFYITLKYHDKIPKGFQVMEQTRNCIWNNPGEMTQKVWKQELPFLYLTHHQDVFFYISVKYHNNIPKGFQVMEWSWICIKKHQRGDN